MVRWQINLFSRIPKFFRKNDKSENYEQQTNQAAGLFLKWLWQDSKAEIYAEFHHNDSKQNLEIYYLILIAELHNRNSENI